MAATFGWLCVETLNTLRFLHLVLAATFGWLCVETFWLRGVAAAFVCSHLRVAVC